MSFWVVSVFAFPYLVEDEYYQKNPLPFDLKVWTTIGIWIGGLFAVVILILLIGKLINWLHFRFSNLLTKGFQKFAQHCIDKNKEMPLAVFVTEVSVATLVITFLSVIIQKIL